MDAKVPMYNFYNFRLLTYYDLRMKISLDLYHLMKYVASYSH